MEKLSNWAGWCALGCQANAKPPQLTWCRTGALLKLLQLRGGAVGAVSNQGAKQAAHAQPIQQLSQWTEELAPGFCMNAVALQPTRASERPHFTPTNVLITTVPSQKSGATVSVVIPFFWLVSCSSHFRASQNHKPACVCKAAPLQPEKHFTKTHT